MFFICEPTKKSLIYSVLWKCRLQLHSFWHVLLVNCPWGSLIFFNLRKRLEEIVSSTSLQLDPFFWAFNNFKMWYIISPCSVLYKKIVHLMWILHYFLSWYESQNHMSSFGLCVKLFIGFLVFFVRANVLWKGLLVMIHNHTGCICLLPMWFSKCLLKSPGSTDAML